ncbi:MAG: winged helix-turn-helix domain-containing protein [Woeseiaceae bacterium]|nr:winged helix-turn-helix domain-containing protein [Woeseiaceae bacterium]
MHEAPDNSPVRYSIGDLVLDAGARRVTRDGKQLTMGGLTFDLLRVLADAAPSMVSYDDLAEQVWKGRPVTPETIAQRAKMLRDALSDDAKSPRYFEPIRGQGYRLVADVATLPSASRRKSTRRPILLASATLAAIALVAFFFGMRSDSDLSAPSVAVLPFADMSETGEQKYLADGFAEELINQLARLDGLEVASRTESFNFREGNNDLQEIGRALNVTAILEGSIRRSENEIRVTVQLIDVGSGYHLWSENFDRELEDIFAIQDEIGRAVAGALGVRLGVGTVNEFRGAGTRNVDAYEAFLRGDFARAIEIDPDYAAAWGAQGVLIGSTMWINPAEEAPAIIERAYEHVAKAIELDPQSSQAHANFATLIYATMAWEEAEASFARALSLRRDEFVLRSYARMLMRAGRTTRAQQIHLERDAMLRLPELHHSMEVNVDLALGQMDQAREKSNNMRGQTGRFTRVMIALNEGTVADVQAAIDELPENSIGYRLLYGPVRDLLDTPDAALAFLEELADDPDRTWPYKYNDIALVAAYLDEPEFAFSVFSKELYVTTIRFGTLWYPVMTDVRRLPEFKTFVEDVNLVDYWRTHGWPDFCWPQGDEDFVCE